MKIRKEEKIRFSMERARECFEEANILAETNLWHSVPERLYHACFYAVSALIIKNDIVTSSQTGIKDKFMEEFVSPGIFNREMGDLYKELFNVQHVDHDSPDPSRINPLISQTHQFIESVTLKL